MLPLIEDKGGRHIIRQETDLYFRINELHRHIVGYFVDGHSCILFYFTGDTVQEAFIQPFPGLWHADGRTCLQVPFHRCGAYAGMEGGIVGTDVIPQEFIELCKGVDRIQVKPIKPGFLECSELTFDFLSEHSDKKSNDGSAH